MSTGSASPPDRHSRRKATTRAALVQAARALLVETGPEVSVQAITGRADVALGSFYNHFADKHAVFGAAATDALLQFEDWMISRTTAIADPAELLCSRLRLYGRVVDSHPDVAIVLRRVAPDAAVAPHGYSVRARADVHRAVVAGRLDGTDTDLRLMAVQGAYNALVAVRMHDRSVGPERADDLAALMLQLFGMSPEEAETMAHRPLEDVLAPN